MDAKESRVEVARFDYDMLYNLQQYWEPSR